MKKYPIGLQDFEKLITGDWIYVDKTEFIYKLISSPAGYFFLSRPRRFGKSLFLSTLKAFFEGKRELFKGLYIDSCPDVEWDSRPVIYFDLNAQKYTEDSKSLISRLNVQLAEYETEYKIVKADDDPAIRFMAIIKGAYEKTGKKVVVLVDEYEKPILDAMHIEELSEKYRNILGGFYSVLKSADKYLKFCFLTGVTKFGHLNIFSGLNNLYDLSLDEEYEAICGITQKELIANFSEGISDLAEREGISFDNAVALLKENYDGYHFSRRMEDIYNPFSLINCLAAKNIGPYWYVTGTPTFLITQMKANKIRVNKLDNYMAGWAQLTGIGMGIGDSITVLYQAGYLTIKGFDKRRDKFILGFPNKEVEQAFLDNLLPIYADIQSSQSSGLLNGMTDELFDGEIDNFLTDFNVLFASFPYETALETERHFHNIFYTVTTLLGYTVEMESHTSNGSIDLTLKTDDYIYIFEFKVDKSPDEALEQIERKGYALPFKADGRKIFKVGVEFSTAERRISNWKYVED